MKLSTYQTRSFIPVVMPSVARRSRPGHITGQGLTEYIIIVALIAIASIVAVSYFGDTVKASFLELGAELSGAPDVNKATLTDGNFKAAEAAAKEATTLQNYKK